MFFVNIKICDQFKILACRVDVKLLETQLVANHVLMSGNLKYVLFLLGHMCLEIRLEIHFSIVYVLRMQIIVCEENVMCYMLNKNQTFIMKLHMYGYTT